ncbi:MFS transporter [Enterobacter hormaechei]|nr:MFS transporter [Enterobacter hormaechei]
MTLFSTQPGDEGLPGPARARVMAAIMTTTLMGVFDGTMINIALPSMAQEMHVPASLAVWFANGYLLAAAMTLAIFAALAARLGYRPVFLAGLATFTLTSLGCALANTSEVLIGMRVLQGIGGAATLSIAPAILRSVFPGRVLGRILGLHALLIASSSAIGPVLGGTILHTLSWQWLFAINIIPGALALLLAVSALPRETVRKVRKQANFDTPGAILSALLLGSTIMAANSLQDATYHLGSLCWTVVAALSGMAFIWQIRRTDNPLLPPTMFKNERFTLAAFTSMIAFVSQGITFIALPFLFQSGYGYSPVVSALLFTPWPLGIVLIAPHAGRWADTISAPVISTLGLMIFVVGLILLATLPDRPSMWDICLRSLVCGMGFGCFQSPNNREMLSKVSREHASYASGVLSIMRTSGQCLGAAAVGVLLATDDRSIHVALWIAAAVSAVSVVVSASRLRKITHPAETG